jgi:hypothetical protein
MAIQYSIETQGTLLKVVTKGKDENLQEVLDYAHAIIGAALKFNCRKILCDERKLQYTLSTLDTYQLAEEASAYSTHTNRIAIVCSAKYLKDGLFYETVASNRGLTVRVTTDYDKAVDWLNK